MILIRWLAGLLGCGLRAVSSDLSCSPNEAETIRFRHDSNGAYCFGDGVRKVNSILTVLESIFGRRPALAVISPHRRGKLRVNPYQPDNFVVETALLSTHFPPPGPCPWD
jgi:hypothetical protein